MSVLDCGCVTCPLCDYHDEENCYMVCDCCGTCCCMPDEYRYKDFCRRCDRVHNNGICPMLKLDYSDRHVFEGPCENCGHRNDD